MLEHIVHNLKQTLANPDIKRLPEAERKAMTEQINRIYLVEESRLDRQFIRG
jgi:hypothetical protein